MEEFAKEAGDQVVVVSAQVEVGLRGGWNLRQCGYVHSYPQDGWFPYEGDPVFGMDWDG